MQIKVLYSIIITIFLCVLYLPSNGQVLSNSESSQVDDSKKKLKLYCENYKDIQLQLLYDNGTSPYNIDINGTDISTPSAGHVLNNPDCGIYDITVIDAEGKKAECRVIMGLPDYVNNEYCQDEIKSSFSMTDFICDAFKKCSGSYIINNGPTLQFEKLESIENFYISDDTKIELLLNDNEGEYLKNIKISVDVKLENEPCDDGDDCTKDDKYLDCECIGEVKSVLEITKSPSSDFSCENPVVIFTTTQEFDNYYWSINGSDAGYDRTLITNQPGRITLECINNDGCRYREVMVNVSHYEMDERLIHKSKDNICKDEKVILSIPYDYELVEWMDRDFNSIGKHKELTVTKAGLYYARIKYQDCYYVVKTEISTKYPKIKVKPQFPILCDDNLSLSVENLTHEVNEIKWTFSPDGLPDIYSDSASINVSKYGEYSLVVKIPERDSFCDLIFENEVRRAEAFEVFPAMVQNGFVALRIKVDKVLPINQFVNHELENPKGDECYITNLCSNQYIIESNDGDFKGDLIEFVKELTNSQCSCTSNNEVIVMDSACNHIDGFEYFFNHIGHQQFYIESPEPGKETTLWLRGANLVFGR